MPFYAYKSFGTARRRPSEFSQRFYIKGSGVYVPGGEWTKRNGEENKEYIRCVFYNNNIQYVVKLYYGSGYTPSKGRHENKECFPVSVVAYRVQRGNMRGKSEKIMAKGGSGCLTPSGAYNTKYGENKEYVHFSFIGVDNKIYKIKIYVGSEYHPQNGKHSGKTCFPFIVGEKEKRR